MPIRVVCGRAGPALALLSLFLFSGGCRKPDRWEFYLADPAGNRLGTALAAGQKVRAVYRPEEPTTDQIGFQLFVRDRTEHWEVLSLVLEKPDLPAPFVGSDLHAEELPPGSYLVVLIRNDEELAKLSFTFSAPAGEGEAAPAGKTPPPPEAVGTGRAPAPPPPAAFENFVSPPAEPGPAGAPTAFLDPEAMATPESNLEPTPEADAEIGPRPTPEPEILGPESWDLAPGTEILVYREGDGYWRPAAVVRAYQRVFTVRYFDPNLPEEDLERERFRVRSLGEGMEVKISEGDELLEGVIVERRGRTFSVALRADGSVRSVPGGKIVLEAP